jgi:membrane-associated phospholipid phosphatase
MPPMPRDPRTDLFLWSPACAALLALAAAALALADLDRPLLLAINSAAARDLPAWLPSWLTVLGNGVCAVALAAPFLRRAPWIPAAALAGALPAALFSRAGKLLAARPRPAAVLDPALLHIDGPVLSGHNSFPSGHSITIFLLVTAIALGSAGAGTARRAAQALALLAAGLLVAASRVMVGAHWPSDALGGAALGVLAGIGGTWACRRWPWWRGRLAGSLMALGVLTCAILLPWVQTGYPLAQPLLWVVAAVGCAFAFESLARPARAPSDP